MPLALQTARQLRRSPAFSLTVILTLAISVGATTALTAVLRASLLSSLPYPHPAQLLEITDLNLRGFKSSGLVAAPRVDDLATLQHQGHPVFSSVAAFYLNPGQLTPSPLPPLSTTGAAVSGSFFGTLGIPAALGRTLTPADDLPGSGLLLVLSDHLWRQTFAADPSILGRTVRLGTDQATIIGVMPATFNLPFGADLWYPAHLASFRFNGYRGDGTRFLHTIARLAPDTTLPVARQAAETLAHRLALAFPSTDAAWTFHLTALRSSLFGSVRQGLLLLSAAIALVLLVVLVNIAGLQLARNAQRAPEFAIRAALGVSRPRLLLQLVTESTLLLASGSLLGLALGALGIRLLTPFLPPTLLLLQPPHIDLATTLVVCLLLLLFDLVLAGFSIVSGPLRPRSSRSVILRTRRFGRLFTAAQITLSLVLLTLSVAVLGSLRRLLQTPLGFDPTHVLTCSIDLGWNVDSLARHRLYQQAEASLAALPGVSAVGAASALPLSDLSIRSTFDLAGHAPTLHHDAIVAEARSFSPGYLRAMRIPLLAGRPLTPLDAEPNAPPVLAVNQAFVRRYFPSQNPLGQRLLSSGYLPGTLRSSEIVAVIGDVHGTGGELAPPTQPEVYGPEDGSWPHLQFAIRSTVPAATLEAQIRRLVPSLNATASVSHITLLSSTLGDSLAPPRWSAALLSAIAALSLLLVMLGIYGLIAFEVAQRTRELALRLALGSTRAALLRLLLQESALILGFGLGLGLLAGLATSRLLHALSAQIVVAPGLLALLTTALLLTLAVLLATLLPARRAARIDPMQALRAE